MFDTNQQFQQVVGIFSSKGRQFWRESDLEENLKVRQNCLLKCTLRLFEFPQEYNMQYSKGLAQSENQVMLKFFFAFSEANLKLNFWSSCCQRAQLRKSTSEAYGLFTSTLHPFVQRHQHWSGFTPIRTGWKTFKSSEKWFRGQLIRKAM